MQRLSMEDINGRLAKLLDASTSDVGRALGFAVQAYFKRLRRDSVPMQEIQSLCAARGFSLNFVLYGDGHAYAEGHDGARKSDARALIANRLKAMNASDEVTSLVLDVVDALLKGDEVALKKALRNRYRISAAETRLLRAYRQASSADRARISSMATSLATKACPQ